MSAATAQTAQTTATAPASNAPAANDSVNGFRTILAWIFTIFLVALFDKSRFGHVLLTYALISIILVTILNSASAIAWLIAPITDQAPSGPPAAG